MRWSGHDSQPRPAQRINPVCTQPRVFLSKCLADSHLKNELSSRFFILVTAPLRYPLRTFALALICTVLAAMGTSRIHADGSLAAMFSRDNPSAQAMIRVMNDFGAVDELLVLASVPRAGEATPADLDALTDFGQRLVSEISRASRNCSLDGRHFLQA